MRCDACRKKCFPLVCPHCLQSVCVPCRDPKKHQCLSPDELKKIYEDKLKTKMNARGPQIFGYSNKDE